MKSMRNIALVLLFGLLAVSAVLFQVQHAFALSSDVANELTGGAEAVGSAAFGETGGEGSALPARVGAIIKAILGVLGIILVVIFVYAGFTWMTAGGDSKKVDSAKSWMLNAVIGLAITLSAYAITDFVIAKLLEATGS